ncbi:MAG: hypothetical protein V8R52_03455, partial [Coprobacter fastidiosus]
DINKALLACVHSSTYDATGITPMMPASIVARIMPLELKYKNELGYVPANGWENGSLAKGKLVCI